MYRPILFAFPLFALLVGGMSLLPVINLRIPIGDDPFRYLHQPHLQPLYRLWNEFYHWRALKGVSNGEPLNRALVAYRNSIDQIGTVPEVMDLGIDAIADPTRPKCHSLRFTSAKGVVGSIAFTSFENTQGAECRHYPASAKFSDDRSELAVEVRAYSDDSQSDLWIYSVDQSGQARLSRQIKLAKLVPPHAYLADGRMVFRPISGLLENMPGIPCALAADRDGQFECLVPESALGKDKSIKHLFRPIGTANFAILLSTRSQIEIDAYYFRHGASITFGTPSARDVADFALMQSGFIFSKVEPGPDRYQGVKRFYRQHTADGLPLAILEVPVFKTTFSASGTTAFVAHRGRETGVYALSQLSDAGLSKVSLGGGVDADMQIQLFPSRTAGIPNVLLRTIERKVYHGDVDPVRGFIEATSLTPMTALRAYQFSAKSADGTLVPCEFLAAQKANLPLPVVAEVYGSYGHNLSTGVSPFVNALLVNNIGYLFAHVRGGGELGKEWYEDGRGAFNKLRTIEDFEACIDASQRAGFLMRGQVLVQGGSAGVIPAASVALRRPDMVKGAWLDVPYLDSSGRAQNSWRDEMEFGSYSVPAEAAARKQTSPYDQLLIGSNQPGRFLFTCAEFDRVISPWQCMKGHVAVRSQHPNKFSQFVVLKGKDHFMHHDVSEAQINNMKIILSFILDTLQPTPSQ